MIGQRNPYICCYYPARRQLGYCKIIFEKRIRYYEKNKKFISFVLCMSLILAMSVPAFADAPEEIAVLCSTNGSDITPFINEHPLDGTYITMQNHYNVVIRLQPSTSSTPLGTLYEGDTVYIIKYNAYMTDTRDWAYIQFGTIKGYVANDLLG